MARKHKVTFTEVIERAFRCERCGTTGDAKYRVKGHGAWQREGLFDNAEDARERSAQSAAADMTIDADRVSGMLRCPTCKQRNPGALRGPIFRLVTPVLGGALGPLALGGENGVWIALGLWGLAAWLLARELGRFSRAGEAVFRNVVAGKVAKAKAPLPKAMVVKPASPPPMIPVRTSAPEITKPRGPDDGPAFLKGD